MKKKIILPKGRLKYWLIKAKFKLWLIYFIFAFFESLEYKNKFCLEVDFFSQTMKYGIKKQNKLSHFIVQLSEEGTLKQSTLLWAVWAVQSIRIPTNFRFFLEA